MNIENRIKEIENLLHGCITDELSTHESKDGFLVHRYFKLGYGSQDITAAIRLRTNGYEAINTNTCLSFDMFNEKTLSNVSYCEGDFYIVVFENLEDFNYHKQSAIEFNQNN